MDVGLTTQTARYIAGAAIGGGLLVLIVGAVPWAVANARLKITTTPTDSSAMTMRRWGIALVIIGAVAFVGGFALVLLRGGVVDLSFRSPVGVSTF